MGIEFVKGKIASISAAPEQNVTMRYEAQEEDGRLVTREHDLVVLSLGIVPQWNPAGVCDLATDSDAFLRCSMPQIAPTMTSMEGVFVAGVAAGPKDIVDTIAEAGAAAMEASIYLGKHFGTKAA
jgi:heterodisulfide reductase subunit A